MDRPHTPPRGRTLSSAHSLGRVLAVSLVLTLAIPAVVVVLTQPALALAFIAGMATAKLSARPPSAAAWVGRLRGVGTLLRRPAGE